MYSLKFLKKENDLNKILRRQKKEGTPLSILFISLWDEHCDHLVTELKKRYENCTEGTPLYIVDSFHMPHSFVIYKTTKLPHLVQITPKGVESEDYMPHVWDALLPKTKGSRRVSAQ